MSRGKLGRDCRFCGQLVVIGAWGEDGPALGDYIDDEQASVAHFSCGENDDEQ